jgi:hypothetical protein
MNTREAYDAAVRELVLAAKQNHTEALQWLAIAVQSLWERVRQEAVAKELLAFSPSEVVSLANDPYWTRKSLQEIRDNHARSHFRGVVCLKENHQS